MSDIKDRILLEKIQRVKMLLVIYGVFGLFFGVYIFISSVIGLLYHSGSGTEIIGIPFVLAFTLSCIFGGLKEFSSAAKLKDNILLGARDGIYGQLMITIPSAFFVLNIEALTPIKDQIGPIAIFIPIIWILYNMSLFVNLRIRLLKLSSQIKQNPSSK